jgi:short-subunit dehydrogenase
MQSIVITGASSGIGKALALRYASPGVRLGLLGRNEARLRETASECEKRGAIASVAVIDVKEREALSRWLEDFDRASPIDLLIANAGVIAGSVADGDIEPANAARDLVEINLIGTMNTVQPLLPLMIARKRGQIALISSLAAFVPLAHAPSYAASKSAILNYGLSLRDLLTEKGVKVNVICPGYVETQMSKREKGAKPFLMSPERAVDIIMRGLERNKAVIAFPGMFSWSTRFSAILPERLRRRLARPFRFSVPNDD